MLGSISGVFDSGNFVSSYSVTLLVLPKNLLSGLYVIETSRVPINSNNIIDYYI